MQITNSNRAKRKNLHIFVSPTRTVVHKLSKTLDDDTVAETCLDAVGCRDQVCDVRIVQSVRRISFGVCTAEIVDDNGNEYILISVAYLA